MKNNDTEKNGFPIKDGRDYRQLWVEFNVYDTSFLKLKSMSVVAKSIDCESPQKTEHYVIHSKKTSIHSKTIEKKGASSYYNPVIHLFCKK